jgi:hypothetical protein
VVSLGTQYDSLWIARLRQGLLTHGSAQVDAFSTSSPQPLDGCLADGSDVSIVFLGVATPEHPPAMVAHDCRTRLALTLPTSPDLSERAWAQALGVVTVKAPAPVIAREKVSVYNGEKAAQPTKISTSDKKKWLRRAALGALVLAAAGIGVGVGVASLRPGTTVIMVSP